MLNLLDTRIVRTKNEQVATGATFPEEGIAMAYVQEGGITKVQPSTGAAGEIFAGVSYHRNSPPSKLPKIEEVEANAQGVIELSRTPIGGQLVVFLGATPLDVVTVAPSANTDVQFDGTFRLKTTAANAGKVFRAQYLYAPTVEEARTVQGDLPVGGLGVAELGSVGALKDAEFSTSYFDMGKDWTDVFFVKLAAGGNFAPGTPTDHVPNVIVKQTPGVDSQFLKLSANVA